MIVHAHFPANRIAATASAAHCLPLTAHCLLLTAYRLPLTAYQDTETELQRAAGFVFLFLWLCSTPAPSSERFSIHHAARNKKFLAG